MSLRTLTLSGAAVILVSVATGAALAGAWTQPPGASFVKASLLSQRADQRWGCRGGTEAADPDGDFVSRQAFLYGEFGWTPSVTLLGSWAWKDQSIDGSGDYGTRSGSDLRLGLRLGASRGRRALALEGVVSIPTYPASDLSQPPALREQFLPAGSGQVEGELRALWGASLHPWPLYLNADAGYRVRGGGFGDQWLLALETGAAGPRLFGKVELRAAIPGDEECTGDTVGSVALHERSVQWGAEVAVRLRGRFWLGFGVSVPISGRNSLDAPVLGLGLIRWDPGQGAG